MSDECQCEAAGYCQRWKCDVPTHLWKLCQTRADYRELWERVGMQPQMQQVAQSPSGPGSELAKLIIAYGFRPSGGCGGCAQIARQMNENGVQWCRENEEMIVRHMVEEAAKHGWFGVLTRIVPTFAEGGAKYLLHQAIENYEESCAKSS